MKRDMDLVREMLLWMEESDRRIFYLTGDGFKVFKNDTELTLGHLNLLVSAGFVEKTDRGNYIMTWEGHEFADKVRDAEIWRQTKVGAEKVGS